MVLGISISVHHALTSTANRWRATWDGQSLWVNQAAKLWAGRDPWREREQQPARDLLSSSLVTHPGSSSIRSAVAHWRCPGVGPNRRVRLLGVLRAQPGPPSRQGAVHATNDQGCLDGGGFRQDVCLARRRLSSGGKLKFEFCVPAPEGTNRLMKQKIWPESFIISL